MSFDASDIRVAVVGTGFMGQVHTRAIARVGARLTGIVSRSAESAAAATNHWRDSQHFDSLEELLAADVADVVHICTPNHLHARQAMQVFTAGLDVICEKPLARLPKRSPGCPSSTDSRRLSARCATAFVAARAGR